MRGILNDPMGIPRSVFVAAVVLYLVFLVVCAFALRGNLRNPRADRAAVRRSARAAGVAAAAGAAAAVALWFPLRTVFASWSAPYSLCAYLWWTLPLGAGAVAMCAVMVRARRVSRST